MQQDEVDVGDVCHHGDECILYSTVDTMQEEVKTMCPPPVCHQEADVIASSTPSVGYYTKLMEEDNRLTLSEEGEVTVDGVSVLDVNYLGEDDCGDRGDEQNDRGGKTVMSGDDTSGNAVDGMNGVYRCEFKRGLCTLHKIKGDKTQRKEKKWTEKKFRYGWVTSTVFEYSCHLGYSGYTASRNTQNNVQSGQTTLTNSKGQKIKKGIPGIPIGGMDGYK